MWQNSNTWGRRKQIRMTFMMKSRVDSTFGECLLSFSLLSSRIIQKTKDYNIQNCNFASCAVWVRNLVCHFEGGTQTEGFWEQSVEEDIWT
jgi:hypothetical protein